MTSAERKAAEERVQKLSDNQLLEQWVNCHEGTPECELISIEVRRRNLDL